MKWRRLAIVLHRDLGYFFSGVAILFSVSGIAVNHIHDWDPDFIVSRQGVTLELPADASSIDDVAVKLALTSLESVGAYRTHGFPSSHQLKIYLEDGSILASLADGRGNYESIRRRPVFYELNRLHLDPKRWWLVFSDAFAVALIVISVTGLIILRGKNGFKKRGKWLVGAGLLAPMLGILTIS